MRNLHLTFDCMYCSQKLLEDFAKFCGLLRIYELYIRHEGRQVVRNILILLRRKWMLPYFLFPVLQEGSILTFKYVQEQQKMVYSHSASGAADSSLTLA